MSQNTPKGRDILLHICTKVGVCLKTAHPNFKLAGIYTQSIDIFNFLMHMHYYSIKWLVKVSSSRM